MSPEKQYVNLYESNRDIINSHSAAVMNAPREEAFKAFCAQGIPDKKVERFKYTNLKEVFAPDYGVNLNRLEMPVNPYETFKCEVPNLSTALYFMVNDSFYSKAGPKVTHPDGVIIASLKDVAIEKPEFISRYYNKLAQNKDSICSLNTMLAQDGLFIYVPKKVKVERAIQVINVLRSDVELMVNRRVLIVVEEGADVKLLICDHAIDNRSFLATHVVEAFVGDNASLEMYCLEETHAKNNLVSVTYIEQQAYSRVSHNALTLHNGLTRNQLELVFQGEGAECYCNGCAIVDKEQHVDNNTLIDHRVGHCQSNELYKYVLNDKSVGAFAGMVLVEKEAQKTNSTMRNQNICATKQARMFTQPMLEIYADDVKCSHGSTVGQLNSQALFYMQQRGIPIEEAKLLLQFAFINEVVDNIKLEPLRNKLHYLVEQRFRGRLNKCEGCQLCK